MSAGASMTEIESVAKTFVMHVTGTRVPILRNLTLQVRAGECAVLDGPSGIGKSSILRMIYGNYRVGTGRVAVRDGEAWVDVATATPRRVLRLRQSTVGYISQFLRTIPRVAAIDVVAAAARQADLSGDIAIARAAEMLTRLNIPEHLWRLPPATFSGGEQQRVNIARGLVGSHPILLLDEPTASLDAGNRAAVVEFIQARKKAGAALLGIFHDEEVRSHVVDHVFDVTRFATLTSRP
jgi:alpha-D-ribose 1-methylphosphonate 5-triphosphate synthase subunit PhnL